MKQRLHLRLLNEDATCSLPTKNKQILVLAFDRKEKDVMETEMENHGTGWNIINMNIPLLEWNILHLVDINAQVCYIYYTYLHLHL